MAWEWSHAPEAYANGLEVLSRFPLKELQVILAEWNSTEFRNPDTMEGPDLDLTVYEDELAKVKEADHKRHMAGYSRKERKIHMAEEIWEKASELRTCTNGGHKAWACPYGCGCHLVAW